MTLWFISLPDLSHHIVTLSPHSRAWAGMGQLLNIANQSLAMVSCIATHFGHKVSNFLMCTRFLNDLYKVLMYKLIFIYLQRTR